MSKQKFTLPHSEEKIKEMEERYRKLRVEIDEMNRENWLAQQAENIRKARIVTPAVSKVLADLVAGGTVIERSRYSHSDNRVTINEKTIKKGIFERSLRAGFITRDSERSEYKMTVYVITDLGRQALEAAKQKELA